MDVSHRFQYFDKLFKYEHHFPLQCSCLENSTDRGAWRAIVHEVAKSWTPSTHVQGRRPAKWSCPAVFLPPSLPGTQKSREWVQHCLSVNADFDTGVPWLSLFSPTVKLKRPALPASLPGHHSLTRPPTHPPSLPSVLLIICDGFQLLPHPK